jgi:hypothetical protein
MMFTTLLGTGAELHDPSQRVSLPTRRQPVLAPLPKIVAYKRRCVVSQNPKAAGKAITFTKRCTLTPIYAPITQDQLQTGLWAGTDAGSGKKSVVAYTPPWAPERPTAPTKMSIAYTPPWAGDRAGYSQDYDINYNPVKIPNPWESPPWSPYPPDVTAPGSYVVSEKSDPDFGPAQQGLGAINWGSFSLSSSTPTPTAAATAQSYTPSAGGFQYNLFDQFTAAAKTPYYAPSHSSYAPTYSPQPQQTTFQSSMPAGNSTRDMWGALASQAISAFGPNPSQQLQPGPSAQQQAYMQQQQYAQQQQTNQQYQQQYPQGQYPGQYYDGGAGGVLGSAGQGLGGMADSLMAWASNNMAIVAIIAIGGYLLMREPPKLRR